MLCASPLSRNYFGLGFLHVLGVFVCVGWWWCLFFKSVVLSVPLSHLRVENSFHDHCHPDYLPLPILNQFFSISLDEICNRCSWLFIKPEMFSACSACRRQEAMSQQLYLCLLCGVKQLCKCQTRTSISNAEYCLNFKGNG